MQEQAGAIGLAEGPRQSSRAARDLFPGGSLHREEGREPRRHSGVGSTRGERVSVGGSREGRRVSRREEEEDDESEDERSRDAHGSRRRSGRR